MADNWYLILELEFDPAEKNAEVINKRIKEKVAYWNKRKTMPVDNARECERLASKFTEIVADMGNETIRSRMAAEAVTEISGKVDPKIKQIGKDGVISEEQVKQIANVVEIPLALIKKRCERLGVKIGENPLQALYKKYTDFDADKKMKFDMRLNKDLVAFKADGFDGLYGFLFSESNITKEKSYSISQLQGKLTGANSRANDFNSMHSDNPKKQQELICQKFVLTFSRMKQAGKSMINIYWRQGLIKFLMILIFSKEAKSFPKMLINIFQS